MDLRRVHERLVECFREACCTGEMRRYMCYNPSVLKQDYVEVVNRMRGHVNHMSDKYVFYFDCLFSLLILYSGRHF